MEEMTREPTNDDRKRVLPRHPCTLSAGAPIRFLRTEPYPRSIRIGRKAQATKSHRPLQKAKPSTGSGRRTSGNALAKQDSLEREACHTKARFVRIAGNGNDRAPNFSRVQFDPLPRTETNRNCFPEQRKRSATLILRCLRHPYWFHRIRRSLESHRDHL